MPGNRWQRWEEVPQLTVGDLTSLSERGRKYLKIAATIIDAGRGCTTPFEEFFVSLLLDYAYRGVTPEEVKEELDKFTEEFESMKEAVGMFVAAYPPDGAESAG